MESTLFVLLRLLSKLKITHDKEDIKLRLLSDAQYPSLLSITNILDFLEISYIPVKTDFEHLKNSKLNSIIHIKDKSDSSFATIESIKNKTVTYYDGDMHTIPTNIFKEIWSEVAVFIKPPKAQKNLSLTLKRLIPIIYAFLGLLFILTKFQRELCLIPLLVYVGIIISFHLMQIEIDKSYYSKFCQINSKFNCQKVVAPKIHLFSYRISLADCNFLIFSTITICMLISNELTIFIYLIAIFSLCLTPILVFLIAYQAFILKHWCLLCLCTSFIYLLIGGCYFFYFNNYKLNISLFSSEIILIFILSFFIASAIILSLKKHLEILVQYKSERITSFTLKRNYYVLQQLLTEGEYMDLEYQNAISLKNKNSSITISTVITPFCPHCKVVIKEMLYLLKKHPIEWIIIWNGTISLPDINKEQLGWEELYKTDKQEFIHELYRFANGKQYKVTNIKVSEQTKKEFLSKLRLLKANKIDKFPTILINGKILSKYYTVHDFRYIFNELIEVKKL